ncbi:MAG: hypothetical protein P8Q90_00900 [Candidatus Thalassarchaeaceae archaeon]|nr:hypothetical protein [Candidatus Thalassarchaeaceae archaeon]
MSTRYVNTLLAATIMILVSMNGVLDFSEKENESPELLELVDPMSAPSNPGHTVFAQYITSDNCGYCYQYGSPAHHQAKNNLPDNYVYISYHSASYGNTADAESGNIAPIYGVQHLGESGGAPKTSFGDATLNTGCGSNTCWDSFISSGGNMHSTAADYSVSVGQSDNGDGTSDITVSASYIGSGTAASSIKLYAAVTEKVCNSHVYSDGSKGHNCWEAWLLNNGNYASNSGNTGGTGFETISLASGSASKSWTVPNNLVNGGASNMNVVAALYSGWSTSSFNEDVYAAADGTMAPPIDISVVSFTVDNQDGAPGFMSGDMLDLEVTVRNAGADTYSDGGTIEICHDTTCFGSTSLNTLSNAAGSTNSQTYSTTFDTSSIVNTANGMTGFKAQVVGLTSDGNGANNVQMSYISHDFTPSTDTPMAAGDIAIARGGTLDFDVTGNPRDGVDTLATMTPEFEVAPTGTSTWSSDWVDAPLSLTAAGTQYERYVFTVEPVSTAASGDYDVRARFTDARGQQGDWKSANGAFSLMNGLPQVIDPNQPGNAPGTCPTFPGLPTVKVETNERVSLAGLVCDAETPLSNLVITSQDPSFIAWHASSGEIEVNFGTMQWDSMGNPQPQGLGITINDGEDTNTGTLLFSVIENGQPRWNSIPAQSYNEGGSVQLGLAQYLTDTDTNGNPSNVMDLSLSIVSIEPSNILSAEIYGNTLMASASDDDAFGSVVITVRATDADGQDSEAPIHVHVQNINDAPRFDAVGLENLMVQADDTLELDLSSRLTDIDDDDAEIWATVASNDGMVQYNPISGMLTATYSTAGQYMIQLSAADSNGDTGQWSLMINVVDSMPLTWSTDGSNGDLDTVVTDMYFGKDPTFFLVQLSDVELTNIEAEWQICNTQSGICYEQGIESIESSILQTGHTFTATPSSGNGLANFDEVKIHVTAIGTNGFDYESDTVSYLATQEPGTDDSTGDSNDGTDNEQSGEDGETSQAGGMDTMVIGGIIGLIVLLMIAGVLGAMLLRGGRDEQLPAADWGTEVAFAAPAAVAPPVAAPVAVNSVPDYTHLTPGGQYVTGHAGETVYLGPDGTAWTMQADSSFIRTS